MYSSENDPKWGEICTIGGKNLKCWEYLAGWVSWSETHFFLGGQKHQSDLVPWRIYWNLPIVKCTWNYQIIHWNKNKSILLGKSVLSVNDEMAWSMISSSCAITRTSDVTTVFHLLIFHICILQGLIPSIACPGLLMEELHTVRFSS